MRSKSLQESYVSHRTFALHYIQLVVSKVLISDKQNKLVSTF